MTELQTWLAIFAGLLVTSAIASVALPPKPEWLGFVAVPLVASFVMTAYVFAFDRDAQSPIFLFMFYITAGVAGAFGSLAGRALAKRLRQSSSS
jgi:hypothetical protein